MDGGLVVSPSIGPPAFDALRALRGLAAEVLKRAAALASWLIRRRTGARDGRSGVAHGDRSTGSCSLADGLAA